MHRRQSYFSTYLCLFNCQRKNKKIIYANVYRNTINDGDSQTSPLPIFPEGGGTSVHRLWLLDYFSSWEIRQLLPFCPRYWHTLHLGCLWGDWILYKPYAFSSGSQLPSFLFIIVIYNLLSDKTITQIKSIICWVNKHLLLLCYYLRILFPFLPYGIIFGVSCDFKSQLAFE